MVKSNRFMLLLVAISLFVASIHADDHNKSFEEICADYGYPLEKYHVVTDDGYILSLFRVSHGRNGTYDKGRIPVLFQHGGFDSSDAAFIHGPELSPVFFLVNQGYDVWLGNARGDKYSRNHTTLNPDTDKEFWLWSFYDRIPDDKANIEFIRLKTGYSKIGFIGHSEGFATMISALATEEQQWFKDRVSVVIGLAPVSKFYNLKAPLLQITGYNDWILNAIKATGKVEWFSENWATNLQFKTACGYIPEICMFNMAFITDGAPWVNERKAFSNYMAHFPGGLSVRLLDHELQLYRTDKFQYFDHGVEGNQEKYGQDTPPEIPVENINNIPIAMLVGTSDLLGTVKDNEWLRGALGDNVIFYQEYDYGCSSFYNAKDMHYLDDVADLLATYA